MANHPQEIIVRHLIEILEEALESLAITADSEKVDKLISPILKEYKLVSKNWKISSSEGWLFDIILDDQSFIIIPNDEDALDYTLFEYERELYGE